MGHKFVYTMCSSIIGWYLVVLVCSVYVYVNYQGYVIIVDVLEGFRVRPILTGHFVVIYQVVAVRIVDVIRGSSCYHAIFDVSMS